MRPIHFLFNFLFVSCVQCVPAGPELVVNAAQITEAPQVHAGQLNKRDSPLCGYVNGNPSEAFTCNAPNDCYFFTTNAGFYANKAACGAKGAVTSYAGPYGLCVNFNAGLCPNIASCSSEYTSVLFCASRYPYCIRYEMRQNALDPSYYVMLDCVTASVPSPVQIYFTPTAAVDPVVPTTPIPSPSPAVSSTVTSTTTTSTSTSSSTTSTTTTTTTTSSTTSSVNPTPTSPEGSSETSSGLSVGDKAGIAGSAIAGLAIITGILSAVYKNEFRYCLSFVFCCCFLPRRQARYAEVPMNHM